MDTNFEVAITKYFDAIKADYLQGFSPRSDASPLENANGERMVQEFNAGLHYTVGKNYLKVITRSGSSRSAHSFIVREDGPRFKLGDILKTAGWNTPAKNQARGNIFGAYRIRWTGAEYLR